MCGPAIAVGLDAAVWASAVSVAGQRHTTVIARVSRGFVEQTLWPEFVELDEVLRRYREETTERVIRKGLESDTAEAEVRHALAGAEA